MWVSQSPSLHHVGVTVAVIAPHGCHSCHCYTVWVLPSLLLHHVGVVVTIIMPCGCCSCRLCAVCGVVGAVVAPCGCCGHCLCTACYHLSKWPNCFHGTCSGLMTWQPRCTTDTLSRIRHAIPFPLPSPVIAVVTLNGSVNHMMPVLSTTPVSAWVLVPFPQLSPHICSYHPITPSPCALGQQVIASLSCLIVLSYHVLPPEHAAELLPWYMQWSHDLAAKMHRRHLVWNEACCTNSSPISYHKCSCTSEWQCEPHDACFIHDSCFCPSSSSFPPVKPPYT